MMRISRRTLYAVAVAPVAVVFMAGCASSKTSSSTPAAGGSTSSTPAPASSASSTATATGTAAGTAVTATEKEFSIDLSTKTFAPGAYTFTVNNQGKYPHNLTVEGPGVDKQASPTLAGGKSGTLTVTLQKGSYELWCSVDSHKDKGMDMKIQVG